MKRVRATRSIAVSALRLTLYAAGDSAAASTARMNLASMLDELQWAVEPELVDVFAAPDEAMRQRIFVTPALVIICGDRCDMVIGDLSAREPVMALLRSFQRLSS